MQNTSKTPQTSNNACRFWRPVGIPLAPPCRALLACLCFLATTVQATDFNWGGFGSVGLACSDSNDVDFAVNTQPKGPGRTSRCDTGLDSLLGVQFDWQLNAQFELGLQLIAERQYDASFTPEISVGQLRWHPSRNLTVRLGRMPTPIFLHSENRQVHFTMPWIRPLRKCMA